MKKSTISLDQLLGDDYDAIMAALKQYSAETLWTTLVAQVISYNPTKRTIEAQPLIKDLLLDENDEVQATTLPLLRDVPVIYPSAGIFEITFPITPGDECLILISKQCIDNWFIHGNLQPPFELRSFDLSDGFALLRPFSQPALAGKTIPSSNEFQIRTSDGQTVISISPTNIVKIKTPMSHVEINGTNGNITVQGTAVDVTGSTSVVIEAPSISLGSGAVEPAMLGTQWLTYISSVIELLRTHVHPTPDPNNPAQTLPSPTLATTPPPLPSYNSTVVKVK